MAVPTAVGLAASVWSAAIWMYLQQYCSNCEKIKKIFRPTLIPIAFFTFLRTRHLKPDSREGCWLHSPGALGMALPDSECWPGCCGTAVSPPETPGNHPRNHSGVCYPARGAGAG